MIEKIIEHFEDLVGDSPEGTISTQIFRDYNLPILNCYELSHLSPLFDNYEYFCCLYPTVSGYHTYEWCPTSNNLIMNLPDNVNVIYNHNIFTGWSHDSSYNSYYGRNIKIGFFHLKYNTNYENNTEVTVCEEDEVGQLAYFYHPTLATNTQALGFCILVRLNFTMYKNNQLDHYENYIKILFATTTPNGNNMSIGVSLFAFSRNQLKPYSGNTSSYSWPYSVNYTIRILYSWWMNNPSNDNIYFWTTNNTLTGENSLNGYTNAVDTGIKYLKYSSVLAYTYYTLPWNSIKATVRMTPQFNIEADNTPWTPQ